MSLTSPSRFYSRSSQTGAARFARLPDRPPEPTLIASGRKRRAPYSLAPSCSQSPLSSAAYRRLLFHCPSRRFLRWVLQPRYFQPARLCRPHAARLGRPLAVPLGPPLLGPRQLKQIWNQSNRLPCVPPWRLIGTVWHCRFARLVALIVMVIFACLFRVDPCLIRVH